MNKNLFEVKYFETYYFLNLINNLINSPSLYLRGLDDFFGDNRIYFLIQPFEKFSLLHKFICFIIQSVNYEQIDDVVVDSVVHSNSKLWLEEALEFHSIDFTSFNDFIKGKNIDIDNLEESDIRDYYSYQFDLGNYSLILEKLTEEVFFLLFLNRTFLMKFNMLVSSYLQLGDYEEIPDELKRHFTKETKMKRVNIPKWAKRAVFFRDRGRCCLCSKDLSGILSLTTRENFDHIVPLAKRGVNDITNFQLLCKECNNIKLHHKIETSNNYEKWY